MGGGAWRFDGYRLDQAVTRWRANSAPTTEQIEALYDWALGVAETGPPEGATMPTANEEEYVSLVRSAGAFVTYLAVEQDRSIFVQSIDPAT